MVQNLEVKIIGIAPLILVSGGNRFTVPRLPGQSPSQCGLLSVLSKELLDGNEKTLANENIWQEGIPIYQKLKEGTTT